jgi:hypothetical protein
MSQKSRQAKTKTTRKNNGGGSSIEQLFAGKMLSLHCRNRIVVCPICESSVFVKESATLDKSKSHQEFNNWIDDGDGGINSFDNYSIKSYFCKGCGYSIIVRDPVTFMNSIRSMFGTQTNVFEFSIDEVEPVSLGQSPITSQPPSRSMPPPGRPPSGPPPPRGVP